MKLQNNMKYAYTALLFIIMLSTVATQTEKEVKILAHSFLLSSPSPYTICLVDIQIPLAEEEYELVLLDAKDEQKFTCNFHIQRSNEEWKYKWQEDITLSIPETHIINLSISIPSNLAYEIDKMVVTIKNPKIKMVSQIVKF